MSKCLLIYFQRSKKDGLQGISNIGKSYAPDSDDKSYENTKL